MSFPPIGWREALLAALFSLLSARFVSAQINQNSSNAKEPPLKLEVIPLKHTYTVGETLFVRYKLTSLADGTLGFPPPAAEQTSTFGGYLKTDAMPPRGTDGELFIEGVWPRYPTDEELRRDVANHWIRLGMSEPYTVRKKGRIIVLSAAGEWVLKSTYHPPELKGDKKAIVESFGCAPPDMQVQSDPVTITVVDSSK